jgi:phage terminase small subunit
MPKTKAPKPLTAREQSFITHYLINLNATEAAIAAGYGKTKRSAAVIANRLRRKVHIAEAISTAITERYGASQARVLEELAKLAFYDIGEAVKVKGGGVVVQDFDELDPDVRAAIVGVEERVNDKGHRTVVVKLADKNVALKTLAACLNMRRSPTDAPPTVNVAVQVNTAEASNDVLRRLDAMLPRQLPAPTEQQLPMISAPIVKEVIYVEP